MATKKTDTQARQPSNETPDETDLQEEQAQEAEERRPDETIPGGVYYVRGVRVNAHNQPIDENGKILDKTPLARG